MTELMTPDGYHLKQVRGFWLPASEEHLVSFLENGPEFGGGPTYQLRKLMAAMPLIKNFGHAIDIGAHCGLWSRVMAKMFTRVTAFEPMPLHRECFKLNLADAENVSLIPMALGEREDIVSLKTGPNSSGDTFIDKDGTEHVAMAPLDKLWIGERIDFIKIDCEGYEKFIVEGAANMIRKWRPVIIIEQKPNKGRQFGIGDQDGVKLLRAWGAMVEKEIAGDFIMAFK